MLDMDSKSLDTRNRLMLLIPIFVGVVTLAAVVYVLVFFLGG